MLPKSLDPDTLRTMALAALGILVLLAFLVMRFIQKMVLRVVFLGALVGFGVYVWGQRQELESCVPKNSCQFFGYDVQIPGVDPATP